MATIGTLAMNLAIRFGKFQSKARTARREARLISQSFMRAGRGIRSFNAALLGITTGVGIGGIAVALRQSAVEIDDIAKKSKKLGIATENLVGLKFAGEQTGVEFRKLSMGIQRMTRRVSEAAKGTGESVKALEELGVSARTLNRLAPDKQFRTIAEAMSKVSNQSDRVRLSFKLFDSEGVDLVNTLALGAKGLEEMQLKAEELGATFSASEAAKVEEYKDKLNELRTAMKGVSQEAVISFAPAMAEISEGFSIFLRAHRRIKEGRGRERFQGRGAPQRATISRLRQFNPEPGEHPAHTRMRFEELRRENVGRDFTGFLKKSFLNPLSRVSELAASGSAGFEKLATSVDKFESAVSKTARDDLFSRFFSRTGEQILADQQRARRLDRFKQITEGRAKEIVESRSARNPENDLLLKGTTEAFRAIRQNLSGNESGTKRLERLMKEEVEIEELSKAILQQMLDIQKQNTEPQVVGLP